MSVKTSPEITIIVPVYKVEQYLRRCLDSIVAQTFTDWECILIDDGSPDNCGTICDEYAAKDSRFRVIHQKNAGVSAARNAGLDVARGEWITFIDSDDWIEVDYLGEMYKPVEKSENIDLVLCKVRDTANSKDLLNDREYIYYNGKYGICFRSCWGKLFRHSVIKKNAINFPLDISLAEDTVFSFSFLVHSMQYIFVKKYMYHYYNTRQTSAVHNITPFVIYSACKAVSQIEVYISEKHCEKRFEKDLFELKRNCKLIFCGLTEPNYKKARKIFPEINIKLIFFFGQNFKCKVICFLLMTHLLDYLYPIYKSIKKYIRLG